MVQAAERGLPSDTMTLRTARGRNGHTARMKRLALVSVVVGVGLLAAPGHANRAWTAWHELATLELDDGGSVVLEWRASTHNSWEENVRAQWRVTNRTSRTLGDVAVSTRTYVCAGNRTRTALGEARLLGKNSDLAPGKRRGTKPDAFHKDSCTVIFRVVFPEINQLLLFRLDDSNWQGWGDFGRIVLPRGVRLGKPQSQ